MFGTGRAIKSFQLDIHPITDPAKDEYCTAWGSVSYTTDIDFRNETTDDCIVFYMFVKPDTFNRFAEMVASRAVDEMILSVKDVPGFYSAWSPSISTRDVKVLTNNDEQKIAEPAGFQFSPPRLGAIGTAELFINRRLEFAGSSKAATSEEEQTLDRSQLIAEADSEVRRPTLHMFQSLRRALWSIVCLLALILIVLALR
jgi:hypothetical protein